LPDGGDAVEVVFMLKKARIIGVYCTLLVLVTQRPAGGDETVRPTLIEKTTAEEVLNRQRYLSSGGLTYHAADTVMIEPLLGVGHDVRHRDISLYAEESAHSITAQAGGRISILEGMYVSAALKYPLYSFQSAGTAPSGTASSSSGRGAVDLLNPTGSNLTWTGEVGTALGKRFRSYLYYDKVTTPLMGGTPGHSEDRIGVRFQFNFK
jgi:hypothetical protein